MYVIFNKLCKQIGSIERKFLGRNNISKEKAYWKERLGRKYLKGSK